MQRHYLRVLEEARVVGLVEVVGGGRPYAPSARKPTGAPMSQRIVFIIEVLPSYDRLVERFPRTARRRGPRSIYRGTKRAASAEGWIGGWRSIRCRVSDAVSSVCAVLEEVHLSSTGHRLGAAMCPQLAVEVVDVRLNRDYRDKELACYLPVGVAGCD
jgi:hypothetical protein